MNKQGWLVVVGLIIAALVVYGIQVWQNQIADTPEANREPETEIVQPDPIPKSLDPGPASEDVRNNVVLPGLNESDTFVRDLLADWSLPKAWLAKEDLVRRFVVVLDNSAKGEIPKRQLAFMAPVGEFQVIDKGQRLLIDRKSYLRYDPYLKMLTALPPKTARHLFSTLSPLFAEALAELGLNKPSSDALLSAAIAQIEAIPDTPTEIEVVQPKVFYQFADPALEALSPLQKQVLRMGPINVSLLKAYLQTVQASG